jgi:general nucleoside transport system ATP-binding protein
MFRLELSDVTKRYAGVTANERVSLQVSPGEIHAVLGENGAGKSTLMKIIYGMVQPDSGHMRWNAAPVHIKSPREARARGIAMVFQHFSLFETLSVAQNVWLGLDTARSLAEVSANIGSVASQYGLALEPERLVHGLSVGERQRVEIVRALLAKPQLLILDEPTSVLTPSAVTKLFDTLRLLAAGGCSILYISHKLNEIRELCHRCTVLRAGRVSGEVDPRNESSANLARLMLGNEPRPLTRRGAVRGSLTLGVDRLSLEQEDEFGVSLRDVSLQVHAGEILGVAGVSGNGQQELLAALSGEDTRARAGSVRLFGEDITQGSAARRRSLGLHFVPEERLGRAAVPGLSLARNTLLTRNEAVSRGGWLRLSGLYALTRRLIGAYGVKTRGEHSPAQSLSGGNLQKFIVGREIDAQPKLLIVAQPTWGVDVGAAVQIREHLLALRDAGAAILLVSEELDELFEISDALIVMAGGRVSPRLALRDASADLLGEWMAGAWPEPATASALSPAEPKFV